MKTVLVPGRSKRLGKAIVEHYAAKEWQVLFTARDTFEEGVALANRLGENVACMRCATDNRQSGVLVAKWVQTKTDGLDMLVCNGSSFAGYAIEDTTSDRAHELIASNFTGPSF